MHIVLLCARTRGLAFLEKLVELAPDARLTVLSFRENDHELPFLDATRERAEAAGAHFIETTRVGHPRWRDYWDENPVDLMFCVSWRYMVPRESYERARLGTFVFHDSLLPEYRGFAPTMWSILNGEDHTGVTLFEISEAVDEGDVVDQQRIPIGPDETIADLTETVTATYLELLERNLPALLAGTAARTPQDHARATYGCKRIPEDNQIDWSASSEAIYNLIRAVTRPYPGAYTTHEGKRLRIWAAQRLPDAPHYVGRVPGRIVEVRPDAGSVVLTGDGALLITEVQAESEEAVGASEKLRSIFATLGR